LPLSDKKGLFALKTTTSLEDNIVTQNLHIKFTFPLKILLLIALGAGLWACSDRIALSEANLVNVIASNNQICTEDPKVFGLYTKIMFIIDKSGSNVIAPGTDPDRENGRRATAIKDFLEKNRNNSYISWSFIVFNNDQALSYIPNEAGSNRVFTNDASLMDVALERFKAEPDTGATPYRAALQLAYRSIQTDLKEDPNLGAKYNVIFISDGVPMPVEGNRDPDIYSDVENLIDLSKGNIHLSTVYYGPSDSNAETRLERMADLGLGKYQNTNIDPIINIDNLITGGTSAEPYIIKNFNVYNLSAANCDDGTVSVDSDSDGLCDKDERRYNQIFANQPAAKERMKGKQFSETNRYSFHPAIHDGIYYRHIAFNENIPKDCTDTRDSDFDLATTCEEKYLFNSSPQGPTVRWTEDMLKRGREADPDYFDSDGDGLLDMLEYLFFKNKSSAMNYNNIFERTNGMQNDYLFANRLNPLNPRSSIPYAIDFQRVSPNERGQNCYSYSQSQLPLYQTRPLTVTEAGGSLDLSHAENENVILISYIQVLENNPNSKGILRYSFQKISTKDQNQKINLDTSSFYIWPEPSRQDAP
jgi:hypothetical protein